MRYLFLILLLTGCAHNILGGEYVVQVPAMQLVITDQPIPGVSFGKAHREWKNGQWRYTIFIRGNQTKDGIDFPRYILGHELSHVLRWLSDDIKDPHNDWEYRLFRSWW